MIDILKPYRVIGWDFDDTLIGSDNSPLMWDFIMANPFDQEHHIVTFRSGGYQDYIWDDLKIHQSPLRQENFTKVHAIAHATWASFHDPMGRPLDIPGHPYLFWKGERCALNGIDVLIDDMTEHVAQGCQRHSIPHIHPDDLA